MRRWRHLSARRGRVLPLPLVPPAVPPAIPRVIRPPLAWRGLPAPRGRPSTLPLPQATRPPAILVSPGTARWLWTPGLARWPWAPGLARWPWALGLARNSEGESMTSLSQSVLSTQPVQVQVTAITTTGAAYNPTSDVVQMAFVPQSYPQAAPQTSQWVTASWATDSAGNYWATALVGPANGGAVLAVGSYVVFLRITDNPAVPVLPGPILSIF